MAIEEPAAVMGKEEEQGGIQIGKGVEGQDELARHKRKKDTGYGNHGRHNKVIIRRGCQLWGLPIIIIIMSWKQEEKKKVKTQKTEVQATAMMPYNCFSEDRLGKHSRQSSHIQTFSSRHQPYKPNHRPPSP
jgi:hypothetical protein